MTLTPTCHARHEDFHRIWQTCREEVAAERNDGLDPPAPANWLVGELLALQSQRSGRSRDEMIRAIRRLLEQDIFSEQAGDAVVDQVSVELQVELLVRALHRAGAFDETENPPVGAEVPPQLVG